MYISNVLSYSVTPQLGDNTFSFTNSDKDGMSGFTVDNPIYEAVSRVNNGDDSFCLSFTGSDNDDPDISYGGNSFYPNWGGIPTPMYKCSGYSCIEDDINGTYTTSNCNNECGTPPPPPPATTTDSLIIPPTAAGAMLAAIGGQLADPGFLAFSIIAASIILGFFLMEKLLNLIPGYESQKPVKMYEEPVDVDD